MTRTAAKRRAKRGPARRSISVGLLLSILAVSAIGTGIVLWASHKNSASSDLERTNISIGMAVPQFKLPDLVTGRQFDSADYIGKQNVVLVSYMGWFCPGCEQLLVELQRRQSDFGQRGAKLVVLGSKPESESLVRGQIAKNGITVPILYDAATATTKEIGLWSDMMQMPWMGYLIIDKSGHVTAANLQMSEANGAGPSNVNEIVTALDRVQSN